jgi:hypothetical protein
VSAETAIKNLIEVQQAIEAIDRAIEEAELEDEIEEANDD